MLDLVLMIARNVSGEACPTGEEFRDVIGHFASGVTVITANAAGTPVGTTASAVCSVSTDPPMLLVCMNGTSETGGVVRECGTFAVNILNVDQDALARRFATKEPGKFDGVRSHAGAHGQPLLAGALAHLECRVVERVRGGTHTIYIAEVQSARANPGVPLAYFRGRFGRIQLTPGDR
jgi:flavin reductase (DIM6/NTAB) family NADH-FMN oxidoreductase RutF